MAFHSKKQICGCHFFHIWRATITTILLVKITPENWVAMVPRSPLICHGEVRLFWQIRPGDVGLFDYGRLFLAKFLVRDLSLSVRKNISCSVNIPSENSISRNKKLQSMMHLTSKFQSNRWGGTQFISSEPKDVTPISEVAKTPWSRSTWGERSR